MSQSCGHILSFFLSFFLSLIFYRAASPRGLPKRAFCPLTMPGVSWTSPYIYSAKRALSVNPRTSHDQTHGNNHISCVVGSAHNKMLPLYVSANHQYVTSNNGLNRYHFYNPSMVEVSSHICVDKSGIIRQEFIVCVFVCVCLHKPNHKYRVVTTKN